ncbi:hypothetical protein [Spirosoma jeollabukense]
MAKDNLLLFENATRPAAMKTLGALLAGPVYYVAKTNPGLSKVEDDV